MESSFFVFYLAGVLLFVLNTGNVQATKPTLLSGQGKEIVGFEGEALNFTWTFSNHSLAHLIYFGTLHEYGYIDGILMSVSQLTNGSLSFYTNKNVKVEQYIGRIRWVGDVSKGVASFELSNIKHSDKRSYGIEITYRDNDETENTDTTNLIVKTPSHFIFGPGHVKQNLGESASFTWRYSLTENDQKSLSSIIFGVYKGGRYETLCIIRVENKLVPGFACSTEVRKVNAQSTVVFPTSNATFKLSQIDFEDEAVYSIRLQAEGVQRLMENKTSLVVTDPPKIIEQPKSTTIIEGQTLNLTCKADGKPRPLITWIKDDKVVQARFSERYILRGIVREDAGKYYCVAENDVGEATSNPEAIVDVQYAPSINASNRVNIIHVPIGKTVMLRCPTTANPAARIQWFSNGIPLRGDTNELYEVIIAYVYEYANYTCKAKNAVGEDNVTFDFRQVGPPMNPKVDCDNKDDRSHSRKTIFHWIAPKDDGGSPVLAYTVKRRSFANPSEQNLQEWNSKNISRIKTYVKYELEWQKTFEFTITAWNIYGESKLDMDNTCIITVGKDPGIMNTVHTTTTKPTQDIVPAPVKKDAKGYTSMVNIWLYVGVGGGVIGFVVLVLLIVSFRKRNNSKKGIWYNHHTSFNALSAEGTVLEGLSVNSHLLQSDPQFHRRKQSMVGSPRYQMDPEWTIPREKLCILKVIGNGAFGLVYKGRVHGIGPNTVGWNLVAIKSPYADSTDAEVKDLMKEFELLKTLKPHPHVIKLLGCCEDEGRPLVIIEYVPFGDLLGYLRKSRGENDEYYSDPEIKPNTNLSSQQLLRFGWHVADGMAYLASEKILHRDLAARNVLVGDGLSCKVTDFGMAKDVSNDDIYVRSTEGRLPVKWTAIEALTGGGEYSTKSDVWSFGVVLYEICTIGADPFPGVAAKEIPQHIDSGYRMKRPGHVDPELYEVMLSCWQTDPDDRPTFPELKETLMKLEEVQSRDYINLTECLYQNVNVRGTGPGSLKRTGKGGTLKASLKGNDYHIGPGTQGHVTAV